MNDLLNKINYDAFRIKVEIEKKIHEIKKQSLNIFFIQYFVLTLH